MDKRKLELELNKYLNNQLFLLYREDEFSSRRDYLSGFEHCFRFIESFNEKEEEINK